MTCERSDTLLIHLIHKIVIASEKIFFTKSLLIVLYSYLVY